MMVLVTYDVSTETQAGKRRLAKIAKICCNYGQRVQNSVFECDLDASQFVFVKAKLLETFNEKEDSLRFYLLGNKYQQKIEQYGCKRAYDPEAPMII